MDSFVNISTQQARVSHRVASGIKFKECLLGLVLLLFTASLTVAQDRVNVAASANGGSAVASSTADDYTVDAVIDGDRKGINLTSGGAWRDDTPGVFPDSIQVDFSAMKVIDEIVVVTQQDAWWNPVEPTDAMLFFNNGITSFEVQFWNGTAWQTVPLGVVTGNNRVMRRFVFTSVTTDKIRLLITAAKLPVSTVVEFEAYGIPASSDPNPTPTPSPNGDVEAALAARGIFFDESNNVGFGTTTPIFNDDGTTGAFVGNWVAIDGKVPGAAAYLGLGGRIPTPGHRVGVLNFYNFAMGGVDNRTAAIYSFNGPQLGTGNLEFYTSPNFIGPIRRMQISPTGEVGINHNAGTGTMLSLMGKSTTAGTKALVTTDAQDRATFTIRDDGQVSLDRPGQGVVLKSPNGMVCKKLTINDAGELVVQAMPACP